MKSTVKALIVWLMLLALPLQGFASVTKQLCAPPLVASHASARSSSVLLSASVKASAIRASAGHALADEHAAPHQHPDGKCGTCASCCSGASMAPPAIPALPEHGTRFVSIPFDAHRLASVHLDLPERPPRA